VPVNICIIAPDELKLDPTELKSMDMIAAVAVNLYHTSSSGFPVHPTGILLLAVAFQTVPELLVTPLVSVTAPAQLSFAGGGGLVTQMLKVPLFDGKPVAPE